MPVRLRIQNFQSIKDAEILIEGLSVITGTNNSGKTAVMRAVRGVFTNPPAGPLVRRGEAFLSVELEFDDGTKILWEKGWEKPSRKGNTINRYTINGVDIPLAGRGAPPEVAGLGVREITASSDRVWPQIADQFTGTLFLVDRSGAAVAEALSDVEKVGRLTKALKLSEKDRRSANSELKIRLKDVKTHQLEVERFDGLDVVRQAAGDLDKHRRKALQMSADLTATLALKLRWERCSKSAGALRDFAIKLPDTAQAQAMASSLKEALGLHIRLMKAQADVASYADFDVEFPNTERAMKLSVALRTAESLAAKLRAAQEKLESLGGASIPEFPDSSRAEKLSVVLQQIFSLRDKRAKVLTELADIEVERIGNGEALEAANLEVATLLGDRGLCPTCNTVHQAGQQHA